MKENQMKKMDRQECTANKSVRVFWVLFLERPWPFCTGGLTGHIWRIWQIALHEANWKTQACCNHPKCLLDDGTLMGKYYRERGNRSNVDYRDISKHVIDALIATEDERFYDHAGIDVQQYHACRFFIGKRRWRLYHHPAAGQNIIGAGK